MGKEDERHLWPEFHRAIREIKPRYVVGENVRGLLSWSDGLVLEEVYADLESEGYEVQTFLLPAVSINAPHKRDRVYIVAKDTSSDGRIQRESEQEGAEVRELWDASTRGSDRIHFQEGNASDSKRNGLEHGQETRDIHSIGSQTQGERGNPTTDSASNDNVYSKQGGPSETWEHFPIKSPLCSGDDGLPSELDGLTFSKWRKESLMGYGNAIVPQIAYRIFATIDELENR